MINQIKSLKQERQNTVFSGLFSYVHTYGPNYISVNIYLTEINKKRMIMSKTLIVLKLNAQSRNKFKNTYYFQKEDAYKKKSREK